MTNPDVEILNQVDILALNDALVYFLVRGSLYFGLIYLQQ